MIRLLNTNYNAICVAPMMDWTDRHDRYMLRLISKHACLYTEMVTTGAIIHGDQERHLGFDDSEHPIALQLGGSDPEAMASCAKVAQEYGYDEVNINVGCPSDRVQNGRFGACLMAEPETVARCVEAMRESTTLPVTVKTRIGIDDQDSYQDLETFVAQVSESGCDTFIVHARKAWLKGLSPKENRDIPPLDYERVYLLKKEHPELTIIINGGIQTIDEIKLHLAAVDGVMLGRKAYHDPYFLAQVEQQLVNDTTVIPSRAEVVKKMLPYIEQHLTNGFPLYSVARHMLGLFHGEYGARQWRRVISEKGHRKGADISVIEEALTHVNPSP